MLNTVWAVIREGRIELLEEAELPEGARVLVTLLPNDEADFWLGVSERSLADVWGTAEDDVYGQLLKE